MKNSIHTSRLTLRPIEASDWRSIQAIWRDFSRSDYVFYDNYKATDDASVEPRIARWAQLTRQGEEHIFFAVCLDGCVIGYYSLNRRGRGYELGYGFLESAHGHGYARESLAAVLEAAKALGAEAVTAGTALENTPSVRLLRALGFTQKATERLSFYKDPDGNDISFTGGIFEWVP